MTFFSFRITVMNKMRKYLYDIFMADSIFRNQLKILFKNKAAISYKMFMKTKSTAFKSDPHSIINKIIFPRKCNISGAFPTHVIDIRKIGLQ